MKIVNFTHVQTAETRQNAGYEANMRMCVLACTNFSNYICLNLVCAINSNSKVMHVYCLLKLT